jgi:hypothetical protein
MKYQIHHVDMSSGIKEDAIDTAYNAIEKYPDIREIAHTIKNSFERRHDRAFFSYFRFTMIRLIKYSNS